MRKCGVCFFCHAQSPSHCAFEGIYFEQALCQFTGWAKEKCTMTAFWIQSIKFILKTFYLLAHFLLPIDVVNDAIGQCFLKIFVYEKFCDAMLH